MNEEHTRGEDNLKMDIALDRTGDLDPAHYKFASSSQTSDDKYGSEGVDEKKLGNKVPVMVDTQQKTKDKNSEQKAIIPICTLKYWQDMFNLENQEFGRRIANSLNVCWAQRFVDQITTKPDLYGPVWIASTLVFMSIVSASFYDVFTRIFHNNNLTAPQTYNFANLGFLFFLVYGVLFFFPCFMTLTFTCSATEGPSNLQVVFSES